MNRYYVVHPYGDRNKLTVARLANLEAGRQQGYVFADPLPFFDAWLARQYAQDLARRVDKVFVPDPEAEVVTYENH